MIFFNHVVLEPNPSTQLQKGYVTSPQLVNSQGCSVLCPTLPAGRLAWLVPALKGPCPGQAPSQRHQAARNLKPTRSAQFKPQFLGPFCLQMAPPPGLKLMSDT